MAIRLLALDLDGTLLNPRGQITERNLDAIQKAREVGVRIAVVTGRRFRDCRPVALELGLDVPVISHNGALTKHAETLETVAVLPLPLASARHAMEIGKWFGADALVSDDHEGLGVLVYDHVSGENAAFYQYLAWSRRVHGEEEGAKSVQEVPSLDEYLDHDPIHLSFSGGCASMKELEDLLRAQMANTVRIFCTVYPEKDFTLIDIVNSSASKGAGVAAAAAEAGIQQDEIMAIGDNYNDLEMLLFAGTGVVMANAPQSLKEIHGLHPTASNVDDGVALAIEEFILNGVLDRR
ncbi:MAG TPA: Cof-type HAD-IIB family hydrolase [Pyrinomonadaceae bacterium]|nr:Cof-type HAD-IIB family hydrolase [Pyrinomonadaceae bacterium]